MQQTLQKQPTLPDIDKLDVNWEITDKFHRQIYRKAEPFLLTRSNTIHTRIVYHFALYLLKTEKGDPDVVLPATILHDVGWSQASENQLTGAFGPNIKKKDIQQLHEIEGAKIARKILEEMNYPKNLTAEIKEIIQGHDTRLEALSQNDMIVKDSDKLWRFSFEGFTIDFTRFQHTPQENLDWLKSQISAWFFLEKSKNRAYQEIEKRKTDYHLK